MRYWSFRTHGVELCWWYRGHFLSLALWGPDLPPPTVPSRPSRQSVSSVILHSSSPSPTRLIVVSHRVLWFYFLDIIFLEFTSRPKSLRWAIVVSPNRLFFFLFLPPDLCLTTVEVVTSLTPIGGSPPHSVHTPRRRPASASPSASNSGFLSTSSLASIAPHVHLWLLGALWVWSAYLFIKIMACDE